LTFKKRVEFDSNLIEQVLQVRDLITKDSSTSPDAQWQIPRLLSHRLGSQLPVFPKTTGVRDIITEILKN
jgi:hypothetical protein